MRVPLLIFPAAWHVCLCLKCLHGRVQVAMEAYYTVFDQQSRRVGFAPIAGCGQSSTSHFDCSAVETIVPSATSTSTSSSSSGHAAAGCDHSSYDTSGCASSSTSHTGSSSSYDSSG